MTMFRVSVTENFGNLFDELGEESNWGPYVSFVTVDKVLEDLTPLDLVADAASTIGDVLHEEGYLSFDLWQDISDSVDAGAYCRYNFYVTEVN